MQLKSVKYSLKTDCLLSQKSPTGYKTERILTTYCQTAWAQNSQHDKSQNNIHLVGGNSKKRLEIWVLPRQTSASFEIESKNNLLFTPPTCVFSANQKIHLTVATSPEILRVFPTSHELDSLKKSKVGESPVIMQSFGVYDSLVCFQRTVLF